MIEIMIVVSILTLLASLTVSNFLDYTAKARKQGAQAYLASYYSSTKNATMYLGCNPGNFVAVGFNPTGIIRSRILTADGGCDDLPVGFPESKDCVSTAYDKNHSGSECVVGDSYKPLFEEEASLDNVGDRRCPAIDGQSISPDNKGKDYFFKALACSDYDDDPLLMCVCHNGVIGVGKQCSSDECKDCATENCASYECSTSSDCTTDANKPECNSKTRTCQPRSCNPRCKEEEGERCNNGSCESICTNDALPNYNRENETCVQCTVDNHCDPGYSCKNNKCEQNTCGNINGNYRELVGSNTCGVMIHQNAGGNNGLTCYSGGVECEGDTPHCKGNKSCVQCIKSDHCDACGASCEDNQCSGGQQCSDTKPHCDGSRCVECLNDRHCEEIYSDKTTCGGDGVCYDQGEQGP